MKRPPVSFVAWSPVAARSAEIAAALGGESRCFYPRALRSRKLVPLRYLANAARTVGYLAARRPRAVIVTNPPIFPALFAYAYCLLARAPLVLDSHPGSFGLKGDSLGRAMLPVHRWLARRAAATMVTGDDLGALVRGWGGAPLVVHEAPAGRPAGARDTAPARLRILFVTVFEVDEPVEEVLAAAAAVPSVDLLVTGDVAKCPAGALRTAPANVRFLGYLAPDDYRDALRDADVVLALTTEPTSVLRAGYEAVYAGKPLITSSWENLQEVFPYAAHVENTATAIASGLRFAQNSFAALERAAVRARETQLNRWSRQLDDLRGAVADEHETRHPHAATSRG